jgi:hypothetical protein
MNQSRRHAIAFLEKEIKTYLALSLFLSKRGIKTDLLAGKKKTLISPAFYKERMNEAKKLVYELRSTK